MDNIILGMSHVNVKMCDRSGRIGDAPDKDEFCIAYRAQKLADQFKCTLMETNTKQLGGLGGGVGKGSCNMKKVGDIGRDVPIIWRKHKGNIVKGSFCEMDGEWYWSKVATCGCKSCGMGHGDNERPRRGPRGDLAKDLEGKIYRRGSKTPMRDAEGITIG